MINGKFGPISHRFRGMTSFPVEKRTFSYTPPLNPEFENVSLVLDR